MRVAIAILVGLAASAHAEAPAKVTIEHGDQWNERAKTIAIKIGAGPWRKVPKGRTNGPFDISVAGKAVAMAFDVQAPAGTKAFRRWVAIVPGATYRVVGNACAIWGLEVDAKSDDPERVRVDASALPAKAFPLVVTTSFGLGDDEIPDGPGDTVAILDKPGITGDLALETSAMCPRSGTPITVWSKPAKKRLLSETLIPHPGARHTLQLAKSGASFTLAID